MSPAHCWLLGREGLGQLWNLGNLVFVQSHHSGEGRLASWGHKFAPAESAANPGPKTGHSCQSLGQCLGITVK